MRKMSNSGHLTPTALLSPWPEGQCPQDCGQESTGCLQGSGSKPAVKVSSGEQWVVCLEGGSYNQEAQARSLDLVAGNVEGF